MKYSNNCLFIIILIMFLISFLILFPIGMISYSQYVCGYQFNLQRTCDYDSYNLTANSYEIKNITCENCNYYAGANCIYTKKWNCYTGYLIFPDTNICLKKIIEFNDNYNYTKKYLEDYIDKNISYSISISKYNKTCKFNTFHNSLGQSNVDFSNNKNYNESLLGFIFICITILFTIIFIIYICLNRKTICKSEKNIQSYNIKKIYIC
jgi:hypothetical protein